MKIRDYNYFRKGWDNISAKYDLSKLEPYRDILLYKQMGYRRAEIMEVLGLTKGPLDKSITKMNKIIKELRDGQLMEEVWKDIWDGVW